MASLVACTISRPSNEVAGDMRREQSKQRNEADDIHEAADE
jgi:hypothetical protein